MLPVPVFLKAISLSAIALTLGSAPLSAAEVSLQGEGKVQYTPDSVRLQFTARAEAGAAKDARKEVARTVEKWNRKIAPYRKDLADYTDATLSLYSYTRPSPGDNQEPVPVNVASQSIGFELREDTRLLNPILAIAQELELNYHLGDESFFHASEQALEKDALARAIEDARDRCRFVAEKLDKRCGEVKTINVNSSHAPRPMMMAAEASSRGDKSSVSAVGTREITASVSATFELD